MPQKEAKAFVVDAALLPSEGGDISDARQFLKD